MARQILRPDIGEILTQSPLLDAVFPVFYTKNDHTAMHQIGSGVLLRIGEETFGLTAAHVADELRAGRSYAHGERYQTDYGHSAHAPPPANVSRAKDKVDMAYYRLAPDLATTLPPR